MKGRPAVSGEPAAGVLICDDHEMLRTLLTAIIAGAPGLRVVGEAADGNEAIDQAVRLQPDAILLDLAMPNRDGLSALPELRRVAPGARIVVFSGFAGAAVAEEAIALGAASYLEKGADPLTIVATILQALGETPAPASLASPA